MITRESIILHFKDQKKYVDAKQTVDISEHLCFHADGHKSYVDGQLKLNPYYADLISDRRPRESATVQEYREKIYKDITKSTVKKVTNSIQKLFKASDWKVDWSKSENPSSVTERETLESYTEKNFPGFGSVENWAQSYMMKEMLKDPNMIAVVMPISFDVSDTEYRKPVVELIASKDVYLYEEGRCVVVKSQEKHMYTSDGQTREGDVFWFIDNEQFIKVKQTSLKRDYIVEVVADLDGMPAFRLGGEVISVNKGTKVFESFIQGMIPYLDEAAREYSDVQAAVVQHLYPTMWYMEGQNCNKCNGTGQVLKDGRNSICRNCNGEGAMVHSPYKDIIVKKPKFDQDAPITPPGGEIGKSTDITTLQAQRVSDHLDSALSALNMEFLSQVEGNQSGVAKEFDREELHTFIYGVAHHIVRNVLDRVYWWCAWWRYKDQFNNEVIERMLPKVAVPEKYDLISDRMLVQELVKSNEADLDPVIKNEQEIDYVNKRFRNDDQIKLLITVSKRHDPFPGQDTAAINELLLTGAVQMVDAVLSIYMTSFVTEAIADNPEFLTLDYQSQHAILLAKAEEKNSEVIEPDEVIIEDGDR